MTPPFALAAATLLAVLNREAVTAHLNNQPERAEQFYRRALAAGRDAPKPDRAKVHSNLAALYLRQGRFERAAREYRLAIRLTQPHHGVALNNLAEVRRRQGRTAEAVRLFREATELLAREASSDLEAVARNLRVAEQEWQQVFVVDYSQWKLPAKSLESWSRR